MTQKRSNSARSATINDVAERANVSIGTVSRHLNGYLVKPENRARIEEAIQSLSYARNAIASAMKTSQSNMVGLLVPDYDEFHAQLLGQLGTAFREQGFVTLTYCHESNMQAARDSMTFFRSHRVNTLILSGSEELKPEVEEMIAQGVQVIAYDNDLLDKRVQQVKVDNAEVSRQAIEHLLTLGHRKIAIITGDMENWTAQRRLQGYLDAFQNADLTLDPAMIINGDWREAAGHAAMQQLWNGQERPTAVFSSNHQMTLGVLNFVRDHGLNIPQDLSLISFDDISMFRYLTPSITAIAQPLPEIVSAILSLFLAGKASSDPETQCSVRLDCELILRDSTAPPPVSNT